MTGMSFFLPTLYALWALGVAIAQMRSTFCPAKFVLICAANPGSACAFSSNTVRFFPSTIPFSASPSRKPSRQLSREP